MYLGEFEEIDQPDFQGVVSYCTRFDSKDFSQTRWYRSNSSLCQFNNVDLSDANLSDALFMFSSFDNIGLEGANVKGTVFLGVTVDKQPITREWLAQKGAKNSDKAITSLDELTAMMSTSQVNVEMLKFIKKEVRDLHILIMCSRKKPYPHFHTRANLSEIKPFSTAQNIILLRMAHEKLVSHLERLEKPIQSKAPPSLEMRRN